MVVRAVLGDDEALARQKLRHMLAADTGVEVVGEGASPAEILEVVRATAPQILFLDVCIPGTDGFALLDRLQEVAGVVPPRVIFTTAWDAYALRALERNAVDYLMKPFTAERLRMAVDRARAEITSSAKAHDRTGEPGQNGNSYTTRIMFKSRGRVLFLPVSDIRWIGAEENYVRICTRAETHLLRQTMADLEEKLDPAKFARVHRSAIVNLQFVKEVRRESRGDFAVVLVNGQKVPMSRSHHARILQVFEQTRASVA
jgi:two-component system LytT family response regulator